MSIPVVAAALAGAIEERGPTAYLVTVGGDDRPHVVAVTVGWHDEGLVADAGRTTTANVGLHPDVTLIWPARPGSGYSLIVDGRARLTAGDQPSSLAIAPRKAVLHRTPDGDPSSPSCIPLLPPS
ncbi:MAG TPA: pyridoxamine 5'-phosphate oxidase family protein [Acidimicrobiales bacterium]|nr:pyridoxamine 5'-phosphate oxidase family protein [Acidimicrobiales bacterium]